MSNSLLAIVTGLINGFDNEKGCPESAYMATRDLIETCYGSEACRLFVESVNATDDGYYVRNDINMARVRVHIAGLEQPNGTPRRRFDALNRVELIGFDAAEYDTDVFGGLVINTRTTIERS